VFLEAPITRKYHWSEKKYLLVLVPFMYHRINFGKCDEAMTYFNLDYLSVDVYIQLLSNLANTLDVSNFF